jgi:hypothetical protein
MKILSLIYLLLQCILTFAQTNDATKYASVITITDLKKQLTVIASDSMQGRETGTEGQRKAAAYIETQFKAIGLKTAAGMNGYQQFYPLYKDSLLSCKLLVGNSVPEYGIDYISPVITNETGNFYSKEIVFAGYGIEDNNYNDYATLDVTGKTVVFFLGEPKTEGKYLISGSTKSSEWSYPGLSKKLALAAKKGAAGVFIINPMQETFNQRFTENSKKTNVYFPRNTGDKSLNYAILSHVFAKNILGNNTDSLIKYAKSNIPFKKEQLFETAGITSFIFDKYRTIINASNVIGVLEGTDKKDEYVYLTAHYDHLGMRDGKIYFGADDDGSGTAAVIQMAKAFAKAKANKKGPRRTIIFMTFSGEEKGLLGSEYYSEHPVYPFEKTSVDLNTDMVGRIDTERKTADTMNYVYVVGHDKLSSDLPLINEAVNKKYTNLVLDYKFDDPNDLNRIYFRSDHYNFARKGVPVLFFYDGMLKSDYHKPTDTIDKINWPLFETRVRMIFHTALEIANRNEMLKRDIPLPESATRGR